jgi:hypothetical protein
MGRPYSDSQRWQVLTLRFRKAEISFQESRISLSAKTNVPPVDRE